MTLRVVHLLHSLDPAAGGIPAVVGQLAAAQQECGLAADVACVHGARFASGDAREFPKPTVADMVFGTGPFSRQFRTFLETADILHLHGIWDPALLAAARVARRLGKPYVVTPHGMLDPWSMAQKRVKKLVALSLGYRRMLAAAAAIHWLNDDERTLAGPLSLRATPIVVPNGLSRDDLDRPADPADPAAFGGEPYVLFLGRLHPKKGLDVLADAFALLLRTTPARLVVAGPDGGAETGFRARVAELGIAASVSVVGPLYGAAKWAALDGAACFCLPSRQEGFSMAILEALGRGVPVVVSDACHFPEVQTARAGFVVPLVADAVADGLRNALADGARQRMGANGRALVAEKYLWDRIAARWVEICGGLTGSRS